VQKSPTTGAVTSAKSPVKEGIILISGFLPLKIKLILAKKRWL
jgi:hypothetical protein